MIKMIALDLDNTLLNSKKKISLQNEKTLKELHKKGIKVVLCTGRPINAVWPYVKQLGSVTEDDYTITFNGAMVIRNYDKDILFKDGLKLKDFNLVHEFAEQNNLPLDILDFTQVYELTDLVKSTYKEVLNANLQFEDISFNDLPNQEYSKAIMSEQANKLDWAIHNMPDQVKNNYHIVRSQPKIMEFIKKGMDKSVGLEHLLNHFDLNFSNLMAFGDAENDIGMLKNAHLGVVMDNAKDDIKSIGNDVTLDHDEDGVAVYLRKYFDL
ncbi:Cof-type HAD-IIB family hydrolase [Apilactobacillus apisilvae]|uniref:Cof-type HAD-IIB family hydrolase n=1 Tax=Apilactobacillus apisilvae TaxID=2923364 RepID=A0ABY4PFW5_9LACO|nr:Cof-type HAD-IIB family hydrolase [Apilactobacillus apisilvae]UQS84548.1 Cof-type HAD-IIB family hydrolase [Apilactobacillus apisilvae]